MEPRGRLRIWGYRDTAPPFPALDSGLGEPGALGSLWECGGLGAQGAMQNWKHRNCILCIVQCWVAIFLIFFLSGPQNAHLGLEKTLPQAPLPFC